MRVDVYSRQQAVELVPVEGTVVISISSPGKEAPLQEGWDDILRVGFHDVVIPRAEMPVLVEPGVGKVAVVMFDETMAAAIDKFAWKYHDKNFMVHCDAGVSRSVAVGLFLKEIFQAELFTHAIHTTRAANGLVHRMLVRKYWQERLDRQRDGG